MIPIIGPFVGTALQIAGRIVSLAGSVLVQVGSVIREASQTLFKDTKNPFSRIQDSFKGSFDQLSPITYYKNILPDGVRLKTPSASAKFLSFAENPTSFPIPGGTDKSIINSLLRIVLDTAMNAAIGAIQGQVEQLFSSNQTQIAGTRAPPINAPTAQENFSRNTLSIKDANRNLPSISNYKSPFGENLAFALDDQGTPVSYRNSNNRVNYQLQNLKNNIYRGDQDGGNFDIFRTDQRTNEVISNERIGNQNIFNQLSEFSGAGVFPAKVDIYGSTAQVDMPLDWFRYAADRGRPIQSTFDLLTAGNSILTRASFDFPANRRWLNQVNEAAPKIARLIQDQSTDFVFIPGVNSAGLSQSELFQLKNSISVPGTRIVFSHSAGTEATLNALNYLNPQDTKNTVFIFASPRMNYNDFSSRIANAGLSRGQVIVVGSSKDLPHWPTGASFLRGPSKAAITDFGYHPNSGYNYVILSDDVTARQSIGIKPILDHGSSILGILTEPTHRFDLWVNGTYQQNRLLAEILRKLMDYRTSSIRRVDE